MRKYLLAFLPLVAFGQPALVQYKTALHESGSSISATFDSSVTAGNLLIAMCSARGGGFLGSGSISDTRSSTWNNRGNSGTTYYWWDAEAASSGTMTVTCTDLGGTPADGALIIAEFSGTADGPYDVGATASSYSSSLDSGNAATSAVATSLVIGVFRIDQVQTLTAGSGYTKVAQANDGASAHTLMLQYKVVSSTGTYNATATSSGANGWNAWVAVYSGADEPPPAPKRRRIVIQ